MTISDCFSTLSSRLAPTQSDIDGLVRHADGIKARLDEVYGLKKFEYLGSHSRHTAIRTISDLDLFAVLSRDSIRRGGAYVSSSTVLTNIRTELQTRFPASAVSKDGQTIVISFRDGQVDVVPAVFDSFNNLSRPTYLIPDGQGGWMATSPQAHNEFISKSHQSSGNKFTFAVQFVKFWRDCRANRIPISSFHLEVLFADQRTFDGVKSYSQCVRDAFRLLYDRGCRALQDPIGISGWIHAANTDAKLQSARDSVAYALDKADRALYHEQNRQQADARTYWNMVFNGNFPAI